MSGPDAGTPMAKHLGYPLTNADTGVTAEYGWTLEGKYADIGGKKVYVVKQLEFGGFASSAASQCECSVYTTIAPQTINATGEIQAPAVAATHQCRRLGSALWDPKFRCADLPMPTISIEGALVALGGTRNDILIAADPINRDRVASKMGTLYRDLVAGHPKIDEPLQWSSALKIEKMIPGKPPATLGAGTGRFVSGTSLLILKEEGRRAGQVWLVQDAHGHHYLVFERDVTRVKR